MHRTIPYILLFVIVSLLQIYLFNNLAIGSWFSPLVYLTFLVLLPLETPPIAMLLLGLATGMMMDATMGIAGINTLATLPVAFLRPKLIHALSAREDMRDDGVPSPARMGKPLFWSYVVVMILIHHTLFFTLEALSWYHLLRTILRIVMSSIGTLCFIGFAERIFTTRLASHNLL